MTSRRWSLLLVGEAHGLAGRRGSLWLDHPDHYERVEVVEASDYERLSAENEALRNALKNIASIEDEMYGGDWDEIERARQYAKAALAAKWGGDE